MSKACQLFSGSKGNSIFVAGRGTGFLVDVGVSAKRLDTALHNIDIDPDKLSGIFITHEHSDHIKGLRVFAQRHSLPVFAHREVLERLRETGDITGSMTAIEVTNNMELSGVEIIPFALSHDSTACIGYRFNMRDGRSVAVCTDTGYVTDEAKAVMKGSDLVYLESNHEITMLQNGSYPYLLKQRILSLRGHLSNSACSEYAVQLINSGTIRLVLSHLSQENNTPDIAKQTTLCALQQAGFSEGGDFRLSVSAVENYERPIVL